MDKCAVATADIEPVTAIFVPRIDSCSDGLYLILHTVSAGIRNQRHTVAECIIAF